MPMQIFWGVKEVYYGICASSEWNLKERELRNAFCYDKVTLQIDMIGRMRENNRAARDARPLVT